MKFLKLLICPIFFLAISIVISPKEIFASTEFKPQLSWQRSAEAPDRIVTETSIGSKVNDALSLPLDPSQAVFDNGDFTPLANKNVVASGINWASWKQYSSPAPNQCGNVFELRHLQAKFNLSQDFNIANVDKVKIVSPYYPNDLLPINDNAYIYLNGNFIKRVGTSYGASNFGMNGTAPYANETDGWAGNGDLGQTASQYLHSGQNIIDIVAGEFCLWGGMGELELILQLKAPLGPTPFLDLPWDYQSQGQSFQNAAMDIYSFFDHKYPLIFTEPGDAKGKIVTYTGVEESDQVKRYSGHNGYDYPLPNGTPVLAAAGGTASYKYDIDGGETIIVYHESGFFTWYMHLQKGTTITNEPGKTVNVVKGQQIALSGNTGSNTTGPHLHISVIKDLNSNGVLDFDTDHPNGLIDPYGWEGDGNNGTIKDDPWPLFGGIKSSYLWIKPLDPTTGPISQSGGELTGGQAKVIFPEDSTRPNLNLNIYEQPAFNASSILKGISHTFNIKVVDVIGNLITNFNKPYKLIIDYSNFDLVNIIENTLSIYWFNPISQNWEKVPTDLSNKTASAELNHASLFILMGEVKDLTPPTTTINLRGDEGQDNYFRSDVTVSLNASDNGGVGVNETYFSIGNNIDWQLYTQPLNFTQEGIYTIFVHSIDKGRNVETPHSITFHIDKTPPEAKIFIDQDKQDLVIAGIDANQTTVTRADNPTTQKKDDAVYTITDIAGNTLKLDVRERDKEKQDRFKIFSAQYNNDPPILEPSNHFNVLYQGKKDKLNVKEQNFEIKDEVKIRIQYNQKKNQSTIITKQNGQERIKEIKPGLVLLQLTTNKGNLEYSY